MTIPHAQPIGRIPAVLALALAAAMAVLTVLLPASAVADDCPNAAFRHGLSAGLPDCRAYELVSPPDKNGADVAGNGPGVVAAVGGDAVVFASRGSFGDTIGSGNSGQTQYLARRGANGWVVRGITPAQAPDTGASFGSTIVQNFSDDLRKATVWGYDLPGATGDAPSMFNLYVQDNDTRELRTVTVSQADPVNLLDGVAAVPQGASDDLRHVSLTTQRGRLLPEAPVGVPSVYEWHDGTLRLASILPDGQPAAAGATGIPGLGKAYEQYRRMVSPDGSKVLFLSPAPNGADQLYARIDHERTVWISEPETSGPAPEPASVLVQEVSADGRHVIFSTAARLVDEDTNDGPDLYRYTYTPNPATDSNLTLITNTGDMENGHDSGLSVVGSSADAGRIYFYKVSGELFLWDHGVVRLASPLVTNGVDRPTMLVPFAVASTPGGARVSGDGRYVAFLSQGNFSGPGPGYAENLQMFLYDADSGVVRCVSCPAEGVVSEGAAVVPTVTALNLPIEVGGVRPSFLMSDGRVFFSTADRLVAQDVNGVTDAYMFDPAVGGARLLSSGRGSSPASWVEASASGGDVFILTRQQLVAADTDSKIDIYDVRVGGGLPDPPAVAGECEGDGCQGPPGGGPGEPRIGSSAFDRDDAATGRRVGRLRVSRTGRSGALVVRLPSAGRLSWTGGGVRRGSRRFARSGTFRLRLSLAPRARKRLARRGAYRARPRLSFVPVGGGRSRTTASLVFTGSKKGR